MTSVTLLATDVARLGGVQSVLWRLAEDFRAAGLEVRVAALNEPHTHSTKTRGVPVLLGSAPWERLLHEDAWERIGLRRTRRLRLRPLAQQVAARRLRDLVQDGVVLAFDVAAAELVRRAGLARRGIAAHHNSFAAISGTRDERRLRAATAQFFGLVALTEHDAQDFRDAGFTTGEILAIPNAVVRRHAVGDEEPRPFVLAAGRYHPQKAFDVLLEAWALTRARSDYRLLLVGEGPELPALERLRRRLALEDVHIRPPADVRRKLAGASVFVLSSRHEGFPLVVLEAMSAGVPVIATDCAPSIRELLGSPLAGVIVPVEAPAALARAIDEVLDDPDLAARLATGGRLGAARYAPERVIPRWLDLLVRVDGTCHDRQEVIGR